MPKFSCIMIIIFMLIFSGMQAAAQKDALVLYFTFEEGSGDTVEDRSGNGNDGEIIEANWVDGKFGKALEFVTASKSHVLVADNPTLNPEKEICYMAWFFSETYDNVRGIVSKYTGAGNQRAYNLRLHHTIVGALSTEISSNGAFALGASTTDVHSEAVLKDGSWHHATISFRAGDFLRMYVDGNLANESKANATESIFDNNTPMRIGTDFNDEDTRFFNGIIDEVAVFNRALTEAEIKAAMQGDIQAVDANGKLAITWGEMKVQ